MVNLSLLETTLASVFGDPGDPTNGFFIGKLGTVSKKVLKKRLLWPGGKLVNEHLYNENEQPITEAELNAMFGGSVNKLGFNGGKFVKYDPKCMAFPYCSQGAVDKPIKLIGESKETMCEHCYQVVSEIAEAAGKTPEYTAKAIRTESFRKLSEISRIDHERIKNTLQALQGVVEPNLLDKIKTHINMAVIDPWATYQDVLSMIKRILPDTQRVDEIIDVNKSTKTISEMTNLSLQEKREWMRMNINERMYKKLQQEGFLPEDNELNEGVTLESSLDTMMEDDDIAADMYEAIQATPVKNPHHCSQCNDEGVYDKDTSMGTGNSDAAQLHYCECPVGRYLAHQNDLQGGIQDGNTGYDPNDMTMPGDVAPGQGVDVDSLFEAIAAMEDKLGSDIVSQILALKESAFVQRPEPRVAPSPVQAPVADVPAPVEAPVADPAQKKAGVRLPWADEFVRDIASFRDQLMDVKPNSLKAFYGIDPAVQFEDMMQYFQPQEGENPLTFVLRITDTSNDPTRMNKMFMSLLTPGKRGYIAKYADMYDPTFMEEFEETCSKLFGKLQLIHKQLAGANSPLGKDGEDADLPDQEDTYYKDNSGLEDAPDEADIDVMAKTSAATAPTDVPSADINVADDEEEIDEAKSHHLGMANRNIAGNEINEATNDVVIGKNVMADNKKNAQQSTTTGQAAAEATQETVDQKVDAIKNQKFKMTAAQSVIDTKLHGMNNSLDLDYDTELTPERKAEILAMASGEVPADHANVDHDATGGAQLVDAAKARADQDEQQYTSIPDQTTIAKKEKYKVTTVVNEDLDRMKKLMSFSAKTLKENHITNKVNENKFLQERVKTKDML